MICLQNESHHVEEYCNQGEIVCIYQRIMVQDCFNIIPVEAMLYQCHLITGYYIKAQSGDA